MAGNKKIETSVAELYLEKGIDLRHRRIRFGDSKFSDGDEFDFGSIEHVLRGIDMMLSMNNKPIEIHMSSYGGDAYMMLALYDKINESPCKFVFYGRGAIMSAATWIMAGCDERYLSKNTTIMVHNGSADASGRLTDTNIDIAEENRLQTKLEEIYAENSFMDTEFWEEVSKRDLYLTAEEAIALGLADKIVPYRGRAKFRGVRKKSAENILSRRELNKLVRNIYKRIEQNPPSNKLVIDIKKDEYENIKEYDHTAEEFEALGLAGKVEGRKEKSEFLGLTSEGEESEQ